MIFIAFSPSVSLRSTAPSSEGACVSSNLKTFATVGTTLAVFDFLCDFLRTGASPVPTPRRRLHRIVRNSLWLSLTHYTTPLFPQKSRSARLFGCNRPHDGSLSLPTFAVCGQGRALSLRYVVVCIVSFATAFGCLSLTIQLLFFRKNHARLACSVVTALTTARCRYQLLRFADRGKPCPYGGVF